MPGTAARTFACAADLFARSRKLRYDGIAIASRIPRMMMTTRSSMRVKPFSSLRTWPRRRESLAIIRWFLLVVGTQVARADGLPPLSAVEAGHAHPRSGEVASPAPGPDGPLKSGNRPADSQRSGYG